MGNVLKSKIDAKAKLKAEDVKKSNKISARKQSRLKDAMSATDSILSESEERKQTAKLVQMEEEMSNQAVKKINEENAKSEAPVILEPQVKLEAGPETDPESGSGSEIQKSDSERYLELRRKHDSLLHIRTHLRDSMNLLNDATMQSDMLLDYLGKAEIDLIHLEEVESKTDKMQNLVKSVSQRHKDMKLKISEQQKQIDMSNGLVSKYRNTIEEARTEINRLKSVSKTQGTELEMRQAEIAKYKDDKLSLSEQNKLLLGQRALDVADIKLHEQKVKSQQLHIEDQDKLLSKNAQLISVLSDEKETALVELKDVQTRFTGLNTRHVQLQANMDEAVYTSKTECEGFEEKLRHRDTRIATYENDVAVLKKQLAISEEKIASMSHDFARVKNIGEKRKAKANAVAATLSKTQTEVKSATLN